MANHALPTTTDLYANVLLYLHARIDDASKMYSSANTTGTNIPVSTVRWNDTSLLWERNTGTVGTPVWTALSTAYNISINGSVGATTPSTGAFTTLASSGVASLGANSTVGGVLITTVGATQTFTGVNTFNNASSPIVTAKLGPSTTQQHTLSAVTSDTIALLAASQTFTNKTYSSGALGGTFTGNVILSGQVSFSEATAPIISAKIGPSNTQQHTLPVVTSDTIALLAAAQTFTNKTITSAVLSGTHTGNTTFSGQISFTEATAPVIVAKIGTSTAIQHSIPDVTSDTFALLAATQTLTNKTLTSPTINSATSNTPTITTPTITNGTMSGTAISSAAITTSSFSGNTGAFTGNVSSTSASASAFNVTASLAGAIGAIFNNTNAAGYATLQLTSNALNKFIRISPTGVLEYVNSANTTVISSLTDAGVLIAASFAGAGTGLTGTAASLNIGGTAAIATTANALNTANAYTGTTFTATDTITMRFGGLASAGIYHDDTNMAIRTATTTGTIYFQNLNGAATRATLDGSGNFTATANVTAYSDERLKRNWRNVDKGLVSKLAGLKSGIYDRIDEEITQIGVSAQGLQAIMPNAVQRDATSGMLSVAYGNAALVACVELAKEVEALKLELSKLIGE